MNVDEMVIENVERGLVLDAKGKWVPLGEMMEIEYNVLKHLEAGEVLYNGQWMTIQKCKQLQTNGQMLSSGEKAPSSDAGHMTHIKSNPWIVISCNTGEQQVAQENYISLIHQATSEENALEGKK